MKRALLVGINAYQQSALRGCLNDVLSMTALLEKKGFVGQNVRVLKDKDATKAKIMDGLKWLVQDLSFGDTIVFHYSGHGSQVSDMSNDEADHSDEIICPIDVFSGQYITDDMLKQALKLPAGVTADIFLDCCHSGSGLRDFVVEPKENDVVGDRYLDPELFQSKIKKSHQPRKSLREFVLLQGNSATLWAGCRDTQTSADAYLGGKYNGAFTFCLAETISKYPTASRRVIEKRLSELLKAKRFTQLPQLETDSISAEKQLFA